MSRMRFMPWLNARTRGWQDPPAGDEVLERVLQY